MSAEKHIENTVYFGSVQMGVPFHFGIIAKTFCDVYTCRIFPPKLEKTNIQQFHMYYIT